MKRLFRAIVIYGFLLNIIGACLLRKACLEPDWVLYMTFCLPFGFLATINAISAFANFWTPADRGHHWWKNQPLPLRCGQLSSLGIGTALLSWSVLVLTWGWLPEPYLDWFVLSFAALFGIGLALGGVGWRMDQHRQGFGPDGLPVPGQEEERE